MLKILLHKMLGLVNSTLFGVWVFDSLFGAFISFLYFQGLGYIYIYIYIFFFFSPCFNLKLN